MTTASEEQEDATTKRSTTRVCIKNAPLSFTETKLRQHLLSSSKNELKITDCRILKTPQGKSRKLAFVGFATTEMAESVIRDFHQTFALTSKLTVEPAFSKKDQSQHRPWSQHSFGSSRYQAKHPEIKEKKDELQKKENVEATKKDIKEVDRRKQEFLAAMGASAKPWANDDGVVVEEKQVEAPPLKEDVDSSSSSSDDESDVDSVDSGGEGADILKSSAPPAPHASVVSDMDFLRSKATAAENLSDGDDDSSDSDSSESSNDDDVEMPDKKDATAMDKDHDSSSSDSSSAPSSDESDNDDEQKGTTPAHPIKSDDTKETETSPTIAHGDPHRLFVRNLPFTSTEEELQQHFEYYGNITACHIPVDDQKQHKGFAFVSFSNSEDATRARTELDGTDFQGRLMHILPARRSQNSDVGGDGDEEGLTYKQKQERARQKDAASSKGWSASFVRGDAVVDNLADRLGLRKGDILNVKDDLSSGDAAVRLALGETHIIEENREYFHKEGIDMEALVSLKGDNTKRSTTAILVKNLPYDTELEELTKMFHGVAGSDAPQRILLPPSRTIAMVEYGHASDAKRAFRKLAYKRFKYVPLYLEWAPLAAKVKDSSDKKRTADSQTIKVTNDNDETLAEEEPTEPGVSHTIYVKNLNFATTEEELQRTFEKHAKSIRAVKIPTKAAPVKKVRGGGVVENEVNRLSMGFGFVECDSEESVRKAIKALQGTIVDGHALELKRSTKTIASTAPVKKAQGTNPTKVMVRNVPFQATRKELLQLFGSFGQLKKVRLPKKFDGTHRGFAFVEFLTHQEAQTAMKTLSRTHLYGRHLVLEWASDKEDMDTLREKAQRDVTVQPSKNKKIRFQ